MSSHRKMRSKLDIKPFPDDFFSTLNISNLRNGPRVSRVIYKQIKKNSKSLSRVCKRERSLDVNDSYLIATPDTSFKNDLLKFPSIHKVNVDHNATMVHPNDHTNDLSYQIDYETRRKLNQRRLNKYMCSEDRFRKTKKLVFGQDSIFNFESNNSSAKYNSPMPVKMNLHEPNDAKFAIRPFSIECSTATTTSHSTRRPDSVKKVPRVCEPADDFLNFQPCEKVNDVENNNETQIKRGHLKNIKSNIDIEPMKIRVRYKKVDLGKIKLKFRRDKVNSFNYGNGKKDDIPSSNFTGDQKANLLDSPFKTSEKYPEDISRKTAYFGRCQE